MGTGKSFLRHTFERFAPLVPRRQFHRGDQPPLQGAHRRHPPRGADEQILCEPIGRNTAPAIAYAAYWLQQRDPEAQMIVTPADHWVVDEPVFRTIIGECLGFVAEHDALMTVGIRPTRPETGYGYIQVSSDATVCPVKSFTEKPNLELAQTFVQCGEFFWNSGIFVWKVCDIVRAFAKYLPEHHALFSSVGAAFGTPQEAEAVERVFSSSHPISIDYGVRRRPTTSSCAPMPTWAGVTWGRGVRSTSFRARIVTPTPTGGRGASLRHAQLPSSRCPRAKWPW